MILTDYKKILLCFSAVALVTTIASAIQAQEFANLINNGGFESALNGSNSWSVVQGTPISRSMDQRIEGQYAVKFANSMTTGFSQKVDDAKVAVGSDYLVSANFKIDGHNGAPPTGEAWIIVRFHGDLSRDKVFKYTPDANGTWNKVAGKFTVPEALPGQEGREKLRIFLFMLGVPGDAYVDYVQLNKIGSDGDISDGEDLVTNGCFEEGVSANWALGNGASLENDPADVRHGQRAIRIIGGEGDGSFASQHIDLAERGYVADHPVYTVSADVKTGYSGGGPSGPATVVRWDQDQDQDDRSGAGSPNNKEDKRYDDLPDMENLGAGMLINCYKAGSIVRTLRMPSLRSNANHFRERKFSFLVPKDTDAIDVVLRSGDANQTAWFDNVRLTKNDYVSPSASPGGTEPIISQVGYEFGVTEAPESGTYINIANASIQVAIDQAGDPRNENYGKTVWVPKGVYDESRIALKSGIHLKIHEDVEFKRSDPATPQTSMWHGAFIRSQLNNSDYAVPISDVIVEGGKYDMDGQAGSVIAVCGDRVVYRNTNILNWGWKNHSASALYLIGDDTYVHHNSMAGAQSTHGVDAIHLWGGGRCCIMCNDVESGDDAIGIFGAWNRYFNTSDQTGFIAIFDRNIFGVEAFNNNLDSQGARAFACGLPNQATLVESRRLRMESTVTDIRARNFQGKCGGVNAMLTVQCSPAKGCWELSYPEGLVTPPQVQRIEISNGDVEGYAGWPLSEERTPLGILVRTSDVGSCYDVLFKNIRVRNVGDVTPASSGVQIDSAIVRVRKTVWLPCSDDHLPPENLRHDNRFVRLENCILDAQSIGDDGMPDEGEDANFLFRIDGQKGTEVHDLESLGGNVLNPNGDPENSSRGLRVWNEGRHAGRSVLPIFDLGDVNRDGVVGFLDISPFIAIFSIREFRDEADINRNGVVDFLDIGPFIALLRGQ